MTLAAFCMWYGLQAAVHGLPGNGVQGWTEVVSVPEGPWLAIKPYSPTGSEGPTGFAMVIGRPARLELRDSSLKLQAVHEMQVSADWARIVDDLDGDGQVDVILHVASREQSTTQLYRSAGRNLQAIELGQIKAGVGESSEAWVTPVDCVRVSRHDGQPLAIVLSSTVMRTGYGRSRLEVLSIADGTSSLVDLGVAHNRRLGQVVPIGDVDKDGTGDVVVRVGGDAQASPAAVALFSIQSLGRLWTAPSPVGGAIGQGFGSSIATGADVDRDGIHDLAVASDGLGGAVYVYSGASGVQLKTIKNPFEDFAQFGDALQMVPIDHGARGPLLLVGHPDYNREAAIDVGACHIFDLRNGSLVQSLLPSRDGDGMQLGALVALAPTQDSSAWTALIGSASRCFGLIGIKLQ